MTEQTPLSPFEILGLNRTTFLKSAPNLQVSPPDRGIEVAFVGRSNAGKSSAINAILGINGLAKTSKTPGRTQLINYFGIDDERRLVDLPGYGYAKVSDRIKSQIEQLLNEYLNNRHCLYGVIMLMDIRQPLTSNDKVLIDYLASLSKHVHILLTKSDKLGRGAGINTLLSVQKALSTYEGLITVQTFSALKKFGVEQAREVLGQWLTFDN